PAGALVVILQLGDHATFALSLSRHWRRNWPIRPTTPLGRNRVTAMNIAPRKNSQYSGNATVNQLRAPLTMKAPRIAPTSVPRPPTATQIAISIEFAGDISPGLMIPTCGTYSAPAIPQSTADSVQMKSLYQRGS